MQISQVNNNRFYNISHNRNSSAVNFRGCISDVKMQRVWAMLKPTISEIVTGKSINDLKCAMDRLVSKYRQVGINSCSVTVLPNEVLPEFAGKVSAENLKNTKGVLVSVGNKRGPVEMWDRAYETIAVFLPNKLI